MTNIQELSEYDDLEDTDTELEDGLQENETDI